MGLLKIALTAGVLAENLGVALTDSTEENLEIALTKARPELLQLALEDANPAILGVALSAAKPNLLTTALERATVDNLRVALTFANEGRRGKRSLGRICSPRLWIPGSPRLCCPPHLVVDNCGAV